MTTGQEREHEAVSTPVLPTKPKDRQPRQVSRKHDRLGDDYRGQHQPEPAYTCTPSFRNHSDIVVPGTTPVNPPPTSRAVAVMTTGRGR
jgi:hypothetical protein